MGFYLRTAICFALVSLLLACGNGDTNTGPCEPGTVGCPCATGDLPCRGTLTCVDAICVEAACAPGTEGCECFSNDTCNATASLTSRLECQNDLCSPVPCAPGEEGCACTDEGACASEALACNGQQCVSTDCPAGQFGCACRSGDVCDSPGSVCREGVCQPVACTPGELFCSCDSGSCAAGGLCRDGVVCIEAAGQSGASCRDDGSCAAGNRCEAGRCVPCDLGDLGCTCFSSGSCLAGGVCVAGVCAREPGEVLAPPVVPKCYSPCTGDLVTDGEVRVCDADGLLEGCLAGAVCVDGSCVAEGETPNACSGDIECPDFQSCIRGRCYSNCEQDSECPAGLECYRKACRVPCAADGLDCAEGQSCATADGDIGYCEPLASVETPPAPPVAGSFSLSELALVFNSERTSGTFEILNESDRAQTFTVVRDSHSSRTDGSRIFVDENALSWLTLGPAGNEQLGNYQVTIPGNESARVSVASAGTDVLSQWEGALLVQSESLGSRRLDLSYANSFDGRWSGKIYYFASFANDGLDTWIDGGRGADSTLENAFMAQWSQFRNGNEPSNFEQWNAILSATQSGSWDWDSTRAACREANENQDVLCYLTEGGVANYTTSPSSQPVPTGVVDFPFSLQVQRDSTRQFSGRIHTPGSLQYPGNPSVTLSFSGDPSECDAVNGTTCLASLVSFDSTVVVGGRTVAAGACPADFATVDTPWLPEGFIEGTEFDPEERVLFRRECLDEKVPGATAFNTSIARSNPIPDGRSRTRRIELVDGGLINNEQLFVIFRETFESFLSQDSEDDIAAYGYMLLTRSGAELEPEDYLGSDQVDDRPSPASDLGAFCSEELLAQSGLSVTPATVGSQAGALARVLLNGVNASPGTPINGADVHYLCVSSVADGSGGFETQGNFDSGPDGLSCPPGSTVRFFVQRNFQPGSCQESSTCDAVFADWEANPGSVAGLLLDPVWSCADSGAISCDENRRDLRDGKRFFEPGGPTVFVPLQPATEDAFRYRFRFQSRDGSGLGFAPDLCETGSDALPYCYDAAAIEELASRLNCLTHLFTDHYGALGSMQGPVLDALTLNFNDETDGFERLYAELMIMLGDDAFTRASAARFDLAASSVFGFLGSRFEEGGIDLSGGAGYEMYELYRAAQTYQLALDRFYQQAPALWTAINSGAQRNFVGLGTITAYIDRLIRASAQKSRVWSEIAQRYRGFNRADLATRVVERSYASAYVESVVLSHLMLRLRQVVSLAERPQVSEKVRFAALGYRSSMLQMRKVYEEIQADVQFFGFSPDEIPFPVLDPQDTNAFEKQFAFARQRAAVAADKEQQALNTSRAYETDAVAFQNELTRIENTFEDELVTLCGTFEGDDGRIYPAIRRYADRNKEVALLGTPCGFTGTGAIHQAIVDLEVLGLELQSVLQASENVLEQIEIEKDRASQQCGQVLELADFKRQEQGEIATLEEEIRRTRLDLANAQRVYLGIRDVAQVAAGGSGFGFTSAAVSGVVGVAHYVNETIQVIGEDKIADAERDISDLQLNLGYEIDLAQCDVINIDSGAAIATQRLRLAELELEALKAQYRIAQGLSRIQELRNDAERLMSRQEETEAQTINLEAARNDPNVRIYKNDAILNAERTFESALREAYKATKIYEYYTSESYAALGDLFLVRMVGFGDISLESYLDDLEDAFIAFEERFGAPSTRVAVISVRDDVLRIPRYGDDVAVLTQEQRVTALRQALTDPARIDARGHTVFTFSSSLDELSPLTRNHKIERIEAELVGARVGDALGRVYLRSRGTAVVRGLDDVLDYYQLPERTAVINPFFNGQRVFEPAVYANPTLRDRPVVNSRWDLVFNSVDETVNQDIDLSSLTDIRIFIYYTDFTPF